MRGYMQSETWPYHSPSDWQMHAPQLARLAQVCRMSISPRTWSDFVGHCFSTLHCRARIYENKHFHICTLPLPSHLLISHKSPRPSSHLFSPLQTQCRSPPSPPKSQNTQPPSMSISRRTTCRNPPSLSTDPSTSRSPLPPHPSSALPVPPF